ncbi:MAG: hypothetical protein KJ645_00015, partial [Planctomycetes bacterium]|nr:hypothetical protein [Planctomycetota bacterium]
VLLIPSLGQAREIPLEYEKLVSDGGAKTSCCPDFSVELAKSMEKPQGSWKIPALKSEFPVYALVGLGGKDRLLVLDQEKAGDLFYNRVYFDVNGNRDLTDDRAFEEAPATENAPHRYLVHDFALESDSGSYLYSFSLDVEYKGRKGKKLKGSTVDRGLKLFLKPQCWYKGTFKQEDKTYRIAVMDRNGNGLFDDPPALPDLSKMEAGKAIELKGDGLFITSGEAIDPDSSLILGNTLVIGDCCYELDLNVAEKRIRLEEHAGPAGKVHASMNAEQYVLFNTQANSVVMVYEPKAGFSLIPGSYHLYAYRVKKKDGQGGLWVLDAVSTAETPVVEVKADSEGTLQFGEPYVSFAQVPEWSIEGIQKGFSRQASLEFVIRGAGKEKVTSLARISGGQSDIPLSEADKTLPREPGFKVIDLEGRIAMEGRFKYG